jgi:hypothetical protein
MAAGSEVFARTVVALQPYAGEVVPLIVEQLIAGSRAIGTEDEVARVDRTRLRRVLGETPDAPE